MWSRDEKALTGSVAKYHTHSSRYRPPSNKELLLLSSSAENGTQRTRKRRKKRRAARAQVAGAPRRTRAAPRSKWRVLPAGSPPVTDQRPRPRPASHLTPQTAKLARTISRERQRKRIQKRARCAAPRPQPQPLPMSWSATRRVTGFERATRWVRRAARSSDLYPNLHTRAATGAVGPRHAARFPVAAAGSRPPRRSNCVPGAAARASPSVVEAHQKERPWRVRYST
ncbi:arginine/serine-rich coiled-coil protein 2-like [Schistocerca gregaria]|uniref:arginine/serine-rich coiled-coil protein 2-like n=1 Tax=Schistocerca gregaria TaxID=7010 RepID=UPI00211E258B|nr:arginine/serine-rich coiled-coil protein 2-like [Schistocerca gregaria]